LDQRVPKGKRGIKAIPGHGVQSVHKVIRVPRVLKASRGNAASRAGTRTRS
jgi:hypothetical protein